jgi:hypothetical protein
MARKLALFKHRDAFEAYLPTDNVHSAMPNYVGWMNHAAKVLKRELGPKDLSSEGDADTLLAEMLPLLDRSEVPRRIYNERDQSNQRAVFRKYGRMVESNFRGLFPKARAVRSIKTPGTLRITWRDKDSDGYTDVFPSDTFTKPPRKFDLQHDVTGPRGGDYEAKCRVTVRRKSADLNYEVFPKFNNEQKMYLGVMRIQFADLDRTSVAVLLWKEQSSDVFEPVAFETSDYQLSPVAGYTGATGKARRVMRKVRERSGQSAFRQHLRKVYHNTCCISGCAVSEALEGAHIDPYVGPDSDHPQNGLLLRRDLHALFDAFLIGINPRNRTIVVAAIAKTWPGYADLNNKPLMPPRRGAASHGPAELALTNHWRIFTKKNGLPESTQSHPPKA